MPEPILRVTVYSGSNRHVPSDGLLDASPAEIAACLGAGATGGVTSLDDGRYAVWQLVNERI
jgi:hypothetical protein